MQRSIAAIIGLTLIGTLLTAVAPAAAATPADFAAVRAEYAASYDGGDAFNTADPQATTRLTKLGDAAQKLWNDMNKTAGRTYLWSAAKKIAGSSDYIQTNYANLQSMALAWSTRGTSLYDNDALLADITSGLDWMNIHWYNPSTPFTDNWYPWQIGGPLSLNTTTILLYDELSQDQRESYMAAVDYYAPGITYAEGANRAWQAWVEITRGLILDDEAVLLAGKNAIPALLVEQACVPAGSALKCEEPGFYPDGSSVEHKYFAYTTGYGLAYIDTVSRLIAWLSGSPWAITGTGPEILAKWTVNAYLPLLYRGTVATGFNGRDVSRYTTDPNISDPKTIAVRVIAMALRVAKVAPAPSAATIKASIKSSLLSAGSSTYFYETASIPAVFDAKGVLADTGVPNWTASLYKQFPTADRVIQKRPGYMFGVSMYSNRTKTFELLNAENWRGWHTADGMTSLYVGDDTSQYSGNYWPTVDPYRLPGTTVISATQKPATVNSSWYSGGVDLGAQYGTSAMIMGSSATSPAAKKSWFMFDDEIVAIGSGITSTNANAVETIVDNRKLSSVGTDTLTVNGAAMPTTNFSSVVPSAGSAYLSGQTSTSGIGYVFPGSQSITVQRQLRTGKWSDINTSAAFTNSDVQTNTFASLAISHGVGPTNAGYSYITLPGYTAAQTSSYAAAPEIKILSQDLEVHAVKENTLNAIGAQFFTDGAHAVSVSAAYPNFLSSTRKSSVMTRQTPGQLTIAVADPTFVATGTVTVEVKTPTSGVVSSDPGVTVVQTSPTTIIQVDFTNSRGATQDIVLSQ